MFHRSRAPVKVVVAGRQSGKSHSAAEEVVQTMCRRPGTTSLLLAPTYKSTKGILQHVRRALRPLAGKWVWREMDKLFKLWNGATLYVRTADDKSGVPTRGLTVDGVMWVDEAGYVPESSWQAALLCTTAVVDSKIIVTTTPSGKNWVYFLWLTGWPGPEHSPRVESFRFRSLDSPYCNAEAIEAMKTQMGAKRALQELEGHFTADSSACFDPEDVRACLTGDQLQIRGDQLSFGVDLAKEQDFTCITLMNEYGETWLVDRYRGTEWPDQQARLSGLLRKYPDAVMGLDTGAGGGYGNMMYSYLERELGSKARLIPIKTASRGVKAQIIETLVSDIQNHRLRVSAGKHLDDLRHELLFFESHRKVSGGVEHWEYRGPTTKGEHDDTVISLAMANFVRLTGWSAKDPLAGDFVGFGGATSGGGANTYTAGPLGGFGALGGSSRF